jgi:hypothetical protein
MIAVGDLCFAKAVRNVIGEQGSDFLFEKILSWFGTAAVRFWSFECCVVAPGDTVAAQRVVSSRCLRCSPV